MAYYTGAFEKAQDCHQPIPSAARNKRTRTGRLA